MIEIAQIAPKPMRQRTYKLMVVDDDVSVRESLYKLLHGEGYQVVTVANGSETVESFRREQNQIEPRHKQWMTPRS